MLPLKYNPHFHQSTIHTATKVQSTLPPKYNPCCHQSTNHTATKVQSTLPPKYNPHCHQSTITAVTKVQSTLPPKYNPHCHQSTIHTATKVQSPLSPKYNPHFHQSTIDTATTLGHVQVDWPVSDVHSCRRPERVGPWYTCPLSATTSVWASVRATHWAPTPGSSTSGGVSLGHPLHMCTHPLPLLPLKHKLVFQFSQF